MINVSLQNIMHFLKLHFIQTCIHTCIVWRIRTQKCSCIHTCIVWRIITQKCSCIHTCKNSKNQNSKMFMHSYMQKFRESKHQKCSCIHTCILIKWLIKIHWNQFLHRQKTLSIQGLKRDTVILSVQDHVLMILGLTHWSKVNLRFGVMILSIRDLYLQWRSAILSIQDSDSRD